MHRRGPLLGFITLTVALVPAGLVTVQAQGPCGGAMPVEDSFDSRGLFGAQADRDLYVATGAGTVSAFPVASTAVELSGPTVVCREKIDTSTCERTGEDTVEPIDTEIVSMELTGTSDAGFEVRVQEDPDRASRGVVGPNGIPLVCEEDGTIRLEGSAESFFDVFVDVETGDARWTSEEAFHVRSTIPGLPPGPEGIEPADPPPYEHAGGAEGLVPEPLQGEDVDPTLFGTDACHLPFFQPDPPPTVCAFPVEQKTDGRVCSSTFTVALADVSDHNVTSVSTKSVEFPSDELRSVQVGPWQDADGNHVFKTRVTVVHEATAPTCPSGDSVPIEIEALSLHSADPVTELETNVTVDWAGPGP